MAGTPNPMTVRSPNGYNPYDLMSAMQKFIRRSMEREALWCFYELEACNLYSIASNRLAVVVYEDCGMANLDLCNSIHGHIEQMNKWYKAGNGAWRLVLGNIILQACRGKKNRIADHFVCAVAAMRVNGYVVNLEDYESFVFDMHTQRGRKLGRGAKHFEEEGSKIIESTETEDYVQLDYEEEAKAKELTDDMWAAARMKAGSVQNKLF